MAGHNKWSKIRHKKGKNDKTRAQQLGKASKAITVASKACNGDETDMRLQSAISRAKAMQLPKDRIIDAIAKGTAKGGGSDSDLQAVRYDAMMSLNGSRVACIITVLTDNRNRTMPSIRKVVNKMGGEMLQTNANDYIFRHVGQVLVGNVSDEDEFLLAALEAGAVNVEPANFHTANEEDGVSEGNEPGVEPTGSSPPPSMYVVTTEDTDLYKVVQALRDDHGYKVQDFEHTYILQDPEHGGVELTTDGVEELDRFLDRLNEDEDVNNVYHNGIV